MFSVLRRQHFLVRGFVRRLNTSLLKGQVISKRFLGSSISSKKRTNEFVFTSMRRVFVRFLEEIDDLKKPFRN